MSSSLIIDQYVPWKSIVHRLDPRTKITIIFFFVFIVFFANSLPSYSILTVFALASMFTTRIPIRFILKGLTPIWFLIVFTFLLHLFVTKNGPLLFEVLSVKIHLGGVVQGFAISMRFFLLRSE